MFCGGDGAPEQPRSGAQLIESGIRRGVFVIGDVAETQGKNSGNRHVVLVGHANFKRVAQAIPKIQKPFLRLWRQAMAAPGFHEQTEEILEEAVVIANDFAQFHALGVANTPLNRTFVEAPEDLIQRGTQIDLMQRVISGRSEICVAGQGFEAGIDQTDLRIAPMVFVYFLVDLGKEACCFARLVNQGFAMIRKRNRN